MNSRRIVGNNSLNLKMWGDFRGDFKQDLDIGRGLNVKLRSVKVQVRSGQGLVQYRAKI